MTKDYLTRLLSTYLNKEKHLVCNLSTEGSEGPVCYAEESL
jgi:hypothetical protein